MSHSQIFMSFRDGQLAPFSLASLRSVLERHQCKISTNSQSSYFVEFPMCGKDDSIGSEGGISIENGEAIEFAIDRPYYDDPFFALAFDIISSLPVCMFISSGEEAIITRPELLSDLPDVLKAGTVKVATSMADMNS